MGNVRALLGYSAIAVALAATIASGETNEARLVTDAGATNEASAAGDSATTDDADASGASGSDPATVVDQPTAATTFEVGDRVALGDWEVEVHQVTDPYDDGNDFLGPKAGNRWVAVDAEVFNVGAQPRDVAAIFCFNLQDDLNRSFDQELFVDSTVGAPSGEVGSGTSRRGTIVYEVPAEAAGLRLNFKCQLFSNGSVTIQL